MWFAAHGIFYYKLNGRRRQDLYVVHENVYLISATSEKQAFAKAEVYAREACVADPTMTVDGRPATYVFAGFRKVSRVWHRGPRNALRGGDEVTFLKFHLPSMKSVQRLVDGHQVDVRHVC